MVADHPHAEDSTDKLPLPWLLVVVAWVWLLALALLVTA